MGDVTHTIPQENLDIEDGYREVLSWSEDETPFILKSIYYSQNKYGNNSYFLTFEEVRK